jgi:hypothetical protein
MLVASVLHHMSSPASPALPSIQQRQAPTPASRSSLADREQDWKDALH